MASTGDESPRDVPQVIRPKAARRMTPYPQPRSPPPQHKTADDDASPPASGALDLDEITLTAETKAPVVMKDMARGPLMLRRSLSDLPPDTEVLNSKPHKPLLRAATVPVEQVTIDHLACDVTTIPAPDPLNRVCL